MKTPIKYYGGKQQLAGTITRLIPPHRVYVEPFIGGAAVFFAKAPSEVEVINDISNEIVNFYEVLKRDFTALQSEINISLHSRKLHQHARVVNAHPEMFDRVKRAWAVWVLANMSFGGMLDGTFGCDNDGKTTKQIKYKREYFNEQIAIRLQNTQIECYDALRIIRSRDTPETFFYLDPPYPDTDQGHYNGYSSDNFRALLELISKIEGKFLLNSFRHDILSEYTDKHKWCQIEVQMAKPMTALSGHGGHKIEVITANYPVDKYLGTQQGLFL